MLLNVRAMRGRQSRKNTTHEAENLHACKQVCKGPVLLQQPLISQGLPCLLTGPVIGQKKLWWSSHESFCIEALLACAALVLDAFYSQPAPVLCARLLLKAVRCLCASLYLSRSKNKLVGDTSAERENQCSRYVRGQMFLGMI